MDVVVFNSETDGAKSSSPIMWHFFRKNVRDYIVSRRVTKRSLDSLSSFASFMIRSNESVCVEKDKTAKKIKDKNFHEIALVFQKFRFD